MMMSPSLVVYLLAHKLEEIHRKFATRLLISYRKPTVGLGISYMKLATVLLEIYLKPTTTLQKIYDNTLELSKLQI
jgi:hypothetical protein